MDWKIFICDFLSNYLPTLKLEELVDFKKKKKNKKNVSPTESAVVHFYSYSTGHIKDLKNKRV